MLLNKIVDISGLSYVCTNGKNLRDYDVESITRDTREVQKNSLFIAVIGENIDGHNLIEEAISKGATVIVYSTPLNSYNEDTCYIRVKDTRDAMPLISMSFYHVSSRNLKMIGVTGTNGKTTSVFMMKHLLEYAGKKVGLIGTVANYIGDKRLVAERTTPESIQLFGLLKEMKLADCEYCVMEVSSHSISLGRINGLRFERSLFTNLTQDHLDFHKTMEEYYKVKARFVDSAGSCVLNVDDKYGQDILLNSNKSTIDRKAVTTFGINSGYYRAKNVNLNSGGSTFDLYVDDELKGNITLHIPGLYNVYNALGVISTLVGNNTISLSDAINAFETMKSIDGRCEKIYHEKLDGRTVIVDYAHTPDGMDNILKTVREITKGRLISVFGCGGDRDRSKRPIMADISCKYSDLTVFTTDNPRTEKPLSILEEVLVGAKPYDKSRYTVLVDRKSAIEYAVSIAKAEDTVLIMGKGHEDYQIIGTEKIFFSDKGTALTFLDNE